MAEKKTEKLPDFAQIVSELKKVNDDHKRSNIDEFAKSSSKSDKDLAKAWKKEIDTDTSTMISTGKGTYRRIGPDGKPVGQEFRKILSSGEYEPIEPVKKAKGGKVSSASSRGDGCAQRGKTKGRMV